MKKRKNNDTSLLEIVFLYFLGVFGIGYFAVHVIVYILKMRGVL